MKVIDTAQLENLALPGVFLKQVDTFNLDIWKPKHIPVVLSTPELNNQNLKKIGQGVHDIWSDKQTDRQTEMTTFYLSIYKFSLGVCLFESNKRQNGWTDRAQFLQYFYMTGNQYSYLLV